MKNYILLPSDFRNSDKCIDLLLAEGAAGYGVFIMMCEFLRECESYQTQDNPKRIDFALRIGDAALVERVLHNYGLFRNEEGGMLSCPVFTESMRGYDRKREQNRKNALARNSQREQTPNNSATAANSLSETQANAANSLSEMPPNSIVKNSKESVPLSNQQTAATATSGHIVDFGGVFEVDSLTLSAIAHERSLGCAPDILDKIEAFKDDRHNGEVVADAARFFNLSSNQTKLLFNITGGAEIGSNNLMDLIKCVAEARKTNFTAKYPINYILSKLRSYNK